MNAPNTEDDIDRENFLQDWLDDVWSATGTFDSEEIFAGQPENIRSNREIVLFVVSGRGELLQYASKELRGDREVVLAAIRQDSNSNQFNTPHDFPEALQYASKELRDNPEVVLEALEAFGRMLGSDEVLDKEDPGQNPLKWASKELRADRGFMLEAQQRLENAIGFLDERKYWGPNLEGALAYASKELCADKDFMLNAIRQSKYGYDLFYASTNLKNDHELVFEAVSKSADALKYAPKELRDNRDFLRSAIKRKPSIIQYVSVDLSDDVNPVSRIKIKILRSWFNLIGKVYFRGLRNFAYFLIILLISISLPIACYLIGWTLLAVIFVPISLLMLFVSISPLIKISEGEPYPGHGGGYIFEKTTWTEAVKIYYFRRSDEGRKHQQLED